MKRRRYKDNPYYLHTDGNEYTIIVKNAYEQTKNVKVNLELYELFDQFERDDLKELNEYDRHLEHFELTNNDLYNRSYFKQKLTDEIVEEKIQIESLYKALSFLSEVQRRRIKLYYFSNLKLREIAEIENCSIMSVKDSIDAGLEKLLKILNN